MRAPSALLPKFATDAATSGPTNGLSAPLAPRLAPKTMSLGRSCSGSADHRSWTASKRSEPASMAWLLSMTRLKKLGR